LTPGLAGGGDPILGLLDEGDVSPRARAEVARVVVGVAGQPEVVHREGVPLLARHLAGLAPDADRGVGEEALAAGGVLPPGIRRRVGASGELPGEVSRHEAPSVSSWMRASVPPSWGSVPAGFWSSGEVSRIVAARAASISGETSSMRALPVSTVVPERDWYCETSRRRSSPRGRRPGRMSQEPTLDSWIWTLGSRTMPRR